ncbi:hypothetical protein IG631_03966 [Alternaria alternata]|nr:hypothetical protein IG631_03966 [Alternaria alternata]
MSKPGFPKARRRSLHKPLARDRNMDEEVENNSSKNLKRHRMLIFPCCQGLPPSIPRAGVSPSWVDANTIAHPCSSYHSYTKPLKTITRYMVASQ